MSRVYTRKVDVAEARQMRERGAHVREIAAWFGVSRSYIYALLRDKDAPARGHWKRKPLDERVMAKIDVRGPDECWLWTGNLNTAGYGTILPNGSERSVRVHRVVYELFIGPIPVGHDIDHMCHNADPSCEGGVACLHRRCANPAHLEPATRSVNVARGAARRTRTHCPHGHPWTPANRYFRKNGRSDCRLCHLAYNKRRSR